jgi:hypothetical protein
MSNLAALFWAQDILTFGAEVGDVLVHPIRVGRGRSNERSAMQKP